MDLDLPKDMQSDQEVLKMILVGKFENHQQIVKVIQSHLTWRKQKEMHCLTDKIIEQIQKGVIYQYGRDRQFRPIIHIDFAKINKESYGLILEMMCYVCSYVKKMMFLPGKIENWIWIVDIHGKGVLNTPFKLLKQIIDITAVNYLSTLHRFYVYNPSFSMNSLWKMIKNLLDEVVQNKIQFIPIKQAVRINQDIDPSQLEKKFGGTLDSLQPGEFFPFRNTIGHLESIDQQQSYMVKQELNNISLNELMKQEHHDLDEIDPSIRCIAEQELETQNHFKQSVQLLSAKRQYKFMGELESKD